MRAPAAVRRRRTPGPLRVAVTGGSTGLGAALLEQLAARTDLAALVGIDTAPGRVDGVVWRCPPADDAAALVEALAVVTTVVHLAMSYDALAEPAARTALNVGGTARLLEAARVAGVRRVVLVSSVDVYGRQTGSLPVPDDAPLLASADSSLTGDLVELERLADHAGRTGLEVSVLRPAGLVGGRLGAAYDGALVHALSGARLLAVRGVEPLWQVCHVDDLLAALELVTVTPLPGPLPVACEGWLTQREVEELAGRRRLELPAAVAVSTAERLRRVGANPAAPHEVDRLLHPLVVDASRLRAAGWSAAWTNASALVSHLETRASGAGRAGAYTAAGATAAGATVALMGTAALVRRARARRGR